MRKQEVEFFGFLLFVLFFSSYVGVAVSGENLFTPKAYAIRYWDKHIDNKVARPNFLLNKASPLSASESAQYTQFAAQNSLSTHLHSFCKSAHLFCFPLNSSVSQSKQLISHLFASYFSGYGPYTTYKVGGAKNNNKVIVKPKPGMFFRENMLKEGTVMPMPNIQDTLPLRPFLPRSILSKMPFTSSKISELKNIFHASDNISSSMEMESILKGALHECERAPVHGETKRCVGSIEDMIDFAVSILGRSTEPHFTQNINGSNKNILIGNVRGINGGKLTNSVSCHQSLYPYLLYYCHSIPNVRVYESDILDPDTKTKINHGIAICHIDTTLWDSNHAAFLALGRGPGKIEVCHWIFENDLTWTIAD